MQQDRDEGNLVSKRILTSHKLLGAACSLLCNQGLHQIPEQCPFSNTNGQYISYSLCLEGATLLIICPVWPAQAWYPHLLVLLPSHNDLLLNPLGDRHPMITNTSLPLAGWRDHLLLEGISREATDILLSKQRVSTNAQYKSCWAK